LLTCDVTRNTGRSDQALPKETETPLGHKRINYLYLLLHTISRAANTCIFSTKYPTCNPYITKLKLKCLYEMYSISESKIQKRLEKKNIIINYY
jgi:hypothetical protein